MFCDEVAHHLDAFWIIEECNLNTSLSKQVLSSEEISTLPDNHSRDTEEQTSSGAHDARTQSTHEIEVMPVATTTGIADTYNFRMSSRISGLHTEIVTARDHATGAIGEDRSDR